MGPTPTVSAASIGSPVPAIPPSVTDFNGDGYADLAVSVLNGDTPTTPNAGGLYAIYGASAASSASQYWTADSPGMPVPAQDGAQFAFAAIAGDFNADGFSDLAIGASRQDVLAGAIHDAGSVYVLYGSTDGLQTLAPAAQYFDGTTPGFPTPAVPDAFLGRSLIAGDFNGDGYADLGIGAPRQDIGRVRQAGVTVALYGSAGGLSTNGSQEWTQDSPGIPDESEPWDWFGRSLGAGDYNGDGFADLAVGVPLENQEGPSKTRYDSGAVVVIYGSADGLRSTSPDAQYWDQDSPHIKDQAEAGDFFGHNLASGDFNGDGYDDLASAARLEDVGYHPASNSAGLVNVIYGSAVGLQADAPLNQAWTRNSRHLTGSAGSGDQFGFSVAAADFNADGFADLAVGVPFADSPSAQRVGAVIVLFGSADRLQADAPQNQFWTQDTAHVADQAEAYDAFGFSLMPNDFNGDGTSDLAIGVVHEDLEGTPTILEAGACNVLFGGPSGLQTDSPPNRLWTEDSVGFPGHAADVNEFGWWMA